MNNAVFLKKFIGANSDIFFTVDISKKWMNA